MPNGSMTPRDPFMTPPLATAALIIDNLTAGYDHHPAIHHLTVTIPAGSHVALLGPNGAGKSTLLKLIAGILPPMTGRITLPDGWRERIAYLPQHPTWREEFPLAVFDAVALALWPETGCWRPLTRAQRERVAEALAEMGLTALAKRPVATLSGGQQQRVRFAQLLVREAPLVLLDEPFTAMDATTVEWVRRIIARWRTAGVTVLAALHDEAIARSDFPWTLLLARELFMFAPTTAIDWDAWHAQLSQPRAPHDDAPWCAVDNGQSR